MILIFSLVSLDYRSDSLTSMLEEKQQAAINASTDSSASKKPLTIIIFVVTRWLSMLAVFRRALTLRPYLETLWQEQNDYWRRECRLGKGKNVPKKWPLAFRDDMELTNEDWIIITATAEVLEDLESALLALEGDGQWRERKDAESEAYGCIWDYTIAFEFLLSRLEAWKTIGDLLPSPEHFKGKSSILV